jgi:hypothetical protein
MNSIIKTVVADPRCSLGKKYQLILFAYIKYISSYQSWTVPSFATFVISAASLVEVSLIAYRLLFKKSVWMLIFIGGGGTSITANKVSTISV